MFDALKGIFPKETVDRVSELGEQISNKSSQREQRVSHVSHVGCIVDTVIADPTALTSLDGMFSVILGCNELVRFNSVFKNFSYGESAKTSTEEIFSSLQSGLNMCIAPGYPIFASDMDGSFPTWVNPVDPGSNASFAKTLLESIQNAPNMCIEPDDASPGPKLDGDDLTCHP